MLPDIQTEIDTQLKARGFDQYVTSATYLAGDGAWPRGTTHVVTIANIGGDKIDVALVVKPLYATLANLFLKVL